MDASALIAAYHDTAYQVLNHDGLLLGEARIGRCSRDIDDLLSKHCAIAGVFVTAWNPRSTPASQVANEAAHRRLEDELRARDIRFLPHRGVGSDPSWSEEGVFALDLPITEALELASLFQQNAVVAIEAGKPARLLLTSLLGG
jgi:hypothetical protein